MAREGQGGLQGLVRDIQGRPHSMTSDFSTHPSSQNLFDRAVEWAAVSKHEDSFANRLERAKGAHGLTDPQMHFLCGVLLEGGTDVVGACPSTILLTHFSPSQVAIAITTCLMALIRYPELQQRAHEAIDIVCDDEHLPCWADRSRLQYIVMCQYW